MATMVEAPANTAPKTMLKPTPPAPKTATDDPASTQAVFSTAPTPVVTAHPMSAAMFSGIAFEMTAPFPGNSLVV